MVSGSGTSRRSFFRSLGQIAAFDVIIGNKDRFDLGNDAYVGGLPKGNTGNFLLSPKGHAVSIDMDIGIAGPLDDSSTVEDLSEKFTPLVENLKSQDYTKLIHGVLLSLSEGEDEETLTGAFAEDPKAPDWIAEGIEVVLKQVRQLQSKDLDSIVETWQERSEKYGNYVTGVLKHLAN